MSIKISFGYTNYRGETSVRTVMPQQIWYGKTPFHKKPQWLLKAIDIDKQAERDFTLSDCDFTNSLNVLPRKDSYGV